MKKIVLPAEWHKQSFVQLTFPHADTDWQPYLEEATECFRNIAREISLREELLITPPEIPSNDTWARDCGGITVFENGKPVILDFTFNGWGLKFAADKDNLITSKIFGTDCKSAPADRWNYKDCRNFILEGGSIESDGKGTILTTEKCLLSENRNYLSKAEIEEKLKEYLGAERILWLANGYLAGDDTDSHIDTLARFCPNDTIVYVKCEDENDEHFSELQAMENELKAFRTLDGQPYRLLPLPMADAVYYDGERLPATYANFLIINGAVLYPTYRQPKNDERAREVLQAAFPDREIVGIDCSVLIRQHGSLHCVTMQYPEINE
ncbi:MAG: agmatine deiminase family protein [Prevotellaceae bacterium]|jgi:agmatine/peptidylarginine deiminase|nr:agmatine deiminase family protein [Prevotellaceae bacterium]